MGDLIFQVMNTNIESSTEGARVKSDAPVDDQYALWNLMNNPISKLFPFFILLLARILLFLPQRFLV